MQRRDFLPLLAALPPAAFTPRAFAQQAIPITVHKSPTCSCCARWGEYLGRHGFAVTVVDHDDLDATRREHGVPATLQACHTALVDGYVIEGHVPAADIHRLLAERPALAGLSAPGMPQMSPGMMSEQPSGYDVLGFDAHGRVGVYARY